MSTVAAFIADAIPRSLRHSRDFTGDRGWCDLVNQCLRRIERLGLFDLSQRKETGVEVSDNYWITIPSDFRRLLSIYYPPHIDYTEKEVKYHNEFVNGKLKLYAPFDKEGSPTSFTLSSGSTTAITINDTDAAADEWENYLLVPTNGTYRTGIIIGEHSAADGGVTVLNFLHAQAAAIDSTAGYLTDQYLMLQYMAKFTDVSASSSEIPIDDRYEDLIKYWLCELALVGTGDVKQIKLYHDLAAECLEEHKNEAFTPNEDDARPRARSMPGLEDCDAFDDDDSDYIGEG